MASGQLIAKLKSTFYLAQEANALFESANDTLTDSNEYAWFEALAKVVNSAMSAGGHDQEIMSVFEALRREYLFADQSTRSLIDTYFVENLFWNVSKAVAGMYWKKLPDLFKTLYIDFHGKHP